ncbi:metabotropic glutamate receptor [Patella vulgata]|uniref:metabotropic glutamate receptor n=1 Tax=Patella vulgata TaxID=6465 RepID=UPI0024A87166|nr:metabotropic glutamate receptor [Patella vulgata]
MNLRPDTNKRNPWFIEYWEHHFKCKYPGSLWTPLNEEYNSTCTGKERVDESNGFELEAQLQFVSDGVLAFAYAARNMHRDLCGGRFGLCPAMDPIDGNTFRRYLLDVSFKSMNGQDFQFLPNGDGPSRYRILNFRQTSPGEYEWATIGFFRDGNLTISSPPIFRIDQPLHPRSVCSRPCTNIQAIIGHDPCCWTCKDCSTFEYLPTRNACIACPMGTIAALDKSFCVLIPQKYLRYNDGISVSAMGLSSLGIIITVWVAIVFYRHRETPVVKASGRELSFVLLGGIFMCYSMTFVLVSKPMTLTCGAQKIGIGLCFSVCYAAILTKTNRISRIFQAGRRTTKRPKFISPESQLVICGALVACQTVISLIWILISPPEAVPYYSNRADHQLVCSSAIGSTYMIGFSYPICLVVICTIYAVLTRKIPEAFNESKYIGFTMYTTCVIWLAFVAIYFSTAHNIEIRIATMCFSISLSATVTLACMFTPKVHIIIFHPERNIRQSMMVPRPAFGKQNSSCVRVDSGTQSDDYELTHRLNSSGSFCSAYSHNSSATQTFTYSNGNSISTQTLDSMDREFDLDDVEL